MVAEPVVRAPAHRRGSAFGQGAGVEPGAAVAWAAEQVRVAIADLARAVADARGPVAVSRGDERLGALKSALSVIDAASDALGSARLGLIHQVKEAVEAAGAKPGAFVEERARQTRQGLGVVKTEERTAQTLAEHATLRSAAQDGSVTMGHVAVFNQAVQDASDNTRRRIASVQDQLVEAARTVSVPEFRRGLKATVAAWEADEADHSYEAVRARRHLTLSPREGGVKVDGLLDAVAGETLRTALESLTPDPAVGDERTPDQRRADALILLATRTLSLGEAKAGAQVRPHLSILVREDTWLLLTHRRRLLCHATTPAAAGEVQEPGAAFGPAATVAGASASNTPTGTGAGTGTGTGARVGAGQAGSPIRPGYPIAGLTSAAYRNSGLTQEPPLAQLQDGTILPFAALDVLACDALMQRVVLDAEGSPLDVGRTERTFTKDLRRAVLTRDRHCQYPGCALRATWCEVHHLKFWDDEGPTSLANGITLCSRHHHDVHRHALTITITKVTGGFSFTDHHGHHLGTTTRLHDNLLIPQRQPPPAPKAARSATSRTFTGWVTVRLPTAA